MTYEIIMTMDDRCQIRQMKEFIDSLDYDLGLDCDCDGQVGYAISGEIHIYDANDNQMLGILKKIHSDGNVRLNNVITEDAEWYPNHDGYKTFKWVMCGDNFHISSEDITDEKRWNRFLQALQRYEDD